MIDDSMLHFEDQVDASDFSPEKKAAAKELIRRLLEGEREIIVLTDLAEPLGLTPAMIKRHLILRDGRSLEQAIATQH